MNPTAMAEAIENGIIAAFHRLNDQGMLRCYEHWKTRALAAEHNVQTLDDQLATEETKLNRIIENLYEQAERNGRISQCDSCNYIMTQDEIDCNCIEDFERCPSCKGVDLSRVRSWEELE